MFAARLICLFVIALLGVVSTAGEALAQSPSSTTVVASPSPGVIGQQVTLTATVTTGAFPAQGQVSFFDGATPIGSAFVGAGQAFLNISTLALGPHSITAQFVGPDPNNSGSTSVAVPLNIVQATTTTALFSSLNPSAVGQSVTFTATVTNVGVGTPTPTGTVTFTVDGTPQAPVAMAGGSATFTTATLSQGNHSVVATYGGDTDNLGSTSSILSQSVGTPPAITSANATTFSVGAAGAFTVTTTGNPSAALTESGALPAGVTLTDNGNGTATLAGTPAPGSGGVYPITITAANGFPPNATQNFTLTVNSGPAITSANATTFRVGSAGSFTVTTTAVPTATLTQSGSLPTGVTFTDNGNGTATLSGTPAAGTGGTYPITLTAANGVGVNPTQNFTLTVDAAPTITSATHVTFSAGTAGSFTVTSSGFPAAALTESGALPAGVTFTDNGNGTATLAGTPAAGSSGTFALNITAANGVAPNATQVFTLTVNGAPAITSANAVTFTAGTAGTFTVTTTGFPAPALSESGGLPAGVTFTDNGNGTATLAGTPAVGVVGASPSYSLTITASNGNAPNATQAFTLTVNGPPAITSANNATFRVGVAGAFTVTTAGTPHPAVTEAGALPAGLTFTDNGNGTATLSGTPAAGSAGTRSLTITANNGVAPNATQNFTLTVNTGATSTSVTSSLNPSHAGQAVTFTATVTGAAPTGTVQFKDGAANLGAPVTLAGGAAILTTSALTGGSHSITAVYSGDLNNLASTSSPLTQTVNQSATTTSVTSSLNPSAQGQAVSFTATVSSSGGTPTGTVTFDDGGTAIGSASLASGVATLTTSALSVGSHSITAVYGGSVSFTTSTSAVLVQAVSIPADSLKLRALQTLATPVIAQHSGAAISGAVDSAISEGFADGGTWMTPSGTGVRFNFAADPDSSPAADTVSRSTDPFTSANGSFASNAHGFASPSSGSGGATPASRVDGAFNALAYAGPTKAPPAPRYVEQRDWLGWAEVRGAVLDHWGTGAGVLGTATTASTLYGSQINLIAGLTRRLTPNFLVGVLGGYETFDYRSDALQGHLTGDGWTVGSYLGWRLTQTVRFDAAVAYSGIGYDGTAGTASGNFGGERWMLSSGLTGTYHALGLDLEPSARIYTLWEHENAYTDSLGTAQAERDFTTGRASAGAKATYPIAWSSTVALAPYLGVYADYYFNSDNATAALAQSGLPGAVVLEGYSARVTGGLGARFVNGGTVALGAEYSGIGGNATLWTYRARASVPF